MTASPAAPTAASAAGRAAGREPRRPTNLHYIPQAEKTGNLKVVSMARVTEVNVDKDGRASGVTYLKGGKKYFQPAKVVMLATYMYENVRLHAALEVEGVPERPLQQQRAGRQALHGPRARVGGRHGRVPRPAAEPLQRHDRPVHGHRRLGRRQLRPHRHGLHRRRHGERDDGVQADRHRQHHPAQRAALGLGLQGLAGRQRRLRGHARGADGDALLRGQLRRPRSGGQGRSRPAGAADHVRPQGQRDQVGALDAGPAEGLDERRRRAEHLDVSAAPSTRPTRTPSAARAWGTTPTARS